MRFTSPEASEKASEVGSRPAEALLRLPVRVAGIEVGRPVDVVIDLDRRRALGFEVLCGDGTRCYLPLAAARVRENEIVVGSSLLLLAENDLAFYRRRARMWRALRGSVVERGTQALGRLVDVLVNEEGEIGGLVVVDGRERREIAFDSSLSIVERGKVTAA
jgi:hypothetical protein